MKLDEKMEDCGMELNEWVLTAEEQEELYIATALAITNT